MNNNEYINRIAEEFNKHHDFDFVDSCIMLSWWGSTSHGTTIPKPDGVTDKDFICIVIPPLEYTLGLSTFESWQHQWDDLDVVCYSLEKLIRMLLKSNPNALATLWLRDLDCLITSEEWERIKDNRDMFSSKNAYHTFKGFAKSQLNKFETVSTNEWTLKGSAHVFRLLAMGEEFLRTGIMQVYRTHDKEFIRDIKRGVYSKKQLCEMLDQLLISYEQAGKTSSLPEHLDFEAINDLYTGLVYYYY